MSDDKQSMEGVPRPMDGSRWASLAAAPTTAQGQTEYTRASRDPSRELELVDVTSEDDSPSSASQLSCETRYLPLHSELAASPMQSLVLSDTDISRARTASPSGRQQARAMPYADIESGQRPMSAQEGGRHPSGGRSRLAAKFGFVEPKSQPHRAKSPHKDSENSSTDISYGSLETKVLKALLASHKTSKPKRDDRSPYRGDYSPHKYSNGQDTEREMTQQLASSQDTQPSPTDDLIQSLAATKLQALWRGFKTRNKDVEVVRILSEIRARRAEEHIRKLTEDISRQRSLYEQEKHLRLLQMETVKHLWSEVQALQRWKKEVVQSQEFFTQQHSENRSSMSSDAAVRSSVPSSKVNQSWKSVDLTPEHSTVYHNQQITQLQQQVSHLQEVFQSVYHAKVANDPSTESMVTESIRISTDFEDTVARETSGASTKDPQRAVAVPGVASAPENLRFQIQAINSIVLYWSPSYVYNNQGKPANDPLIGYRIYINNHPKALVGGKKNTALIEGLNYDVTYKLHVRAVSALNESASSNTVTVCLKRPEQEGEDTTSSHPPHDPDAAGDEQHQADNMADAGTGPGSQGGSQGQTPTPSEPQQGQGDGLQELGLNSAPKSWPSHGKVLQDTSDDTTSSIQKVSPTNTKYYKNHAAVMPQPNEGKPRKTTVVEMLEHRMKASKTSPENSHRIDSARLTGDDVAYPESSTKVSSSPRVKEGLIRKLDQQPVKKGTVREELKNSAKGQKRSPEIPMKAIAVEDESKESKSHAKHKPMKHTRSEKEDTNANNERPVKTSHRHRKRSDSSSDKDENSHQDNAFIRRGSRRRSSSERREHVRREHASRIPRPSSKDMLVYSPDDALDTSETTQSDSTLKTTGRSDSSRSSSREASRPSSLAHSRSGSREALRLNDEVASVCEKTSESPVNKPRTNVNQTKDEKFTNQDDEIERNTRGRASARETRSNKEKDEARSASAGNTPNRLHDKPPLAKPSPGKERKSMTREEVKRRRTRSDQGSSEDEDSRSEQRRRSSGNTSSGSDKEGSGDRSKPVTSTPTELEASTKSMSFKHRRSNSDFATIGPLPNRPESPASRAATPKPAPNSPRFRRSSSFSKSVSGEGRDAESILRQCISLELLKAAKQQDVRAAADRVNIAGMEKSKALTPASDKTKSVMEKDKLAPGIQTPLSLARSRIDAASIIRKSIERLNSKDTKHKSDGQFRLRSQSLSHSATKDKAVPVETAAKNSNTAPAVLISTDTKEKVTSAGCSSQTADETSLARAAIPVKIDIQSAEISEQRPTNPNNTEFSTSPPVGARSTVKPIRSGSQPSKTVKKIDNQEQATSKSEEGLPVNGSTSSSSPESSVDRPAWSKRHKFGNKAHDLFHKLHIKLSTNKS